MTEADFQTRFRRWHKSNWNGPTSAFEYKISKTESIPFDAVADHQIAALLMVKKGKFYYKIPDAGYDQKPFDAFALIGENAYVVIYFYTKKGEKRFYVIDIEAFVKERKESELKRKSLTRERAKEIGQEFCL